MCIAFRCPPSRGCRCCAARIRARHGHMVSCRALARSCPRVHHEVRQVCPASGLGLDTDTVELT
eukprot:8247533-Pyramimonas_sp.AAC.1